MFNPKALLIDMDDTLFEERDYVESGFKAVAEFLAAERELPADYSYPSMIAFLELEGRGRVFDRIIERFEVRQAEGLVRRCIEVYRNHKPGINLYGGVLQTLDLLSDRYRLGLVTNGLPLMQRMKLEALGIEQYFSACVFCDELGKPKPQTEGLTQALESMNIAAEHALMVGDNPETDGAAAKAAGIDFVRVRTGRFGSISSDGPEIRCFSRLVEFLTP